MPATLKILMLEDDPLDAELEIGILEEAGYTCQWERVETQAAFEAALQTPDYDLILADYNLPSFDGLSALALVQALNLDTPFIIVSGKMGEEIAIESLKAGATDYVLKDRLARLEPVVERALREKAEQKRRRQAEMELNRFFNLSVDILCVVGDDGYIKQVNPAFEKIVGYSTKELQAKPLMEFVHPDDQAATLAETKKIFNGQPSIYFENRYLCRDGGFRWISWSAISVIEEGLVYAVGRDVTERKKVNERLHILSRAVAATQNGIIIADATAPDQPIIYCNPAFEQITGYTAAEAQGRNCRFLQGPETDRAVTRQIRAALEAEQACEVIIKNYRKDGQPFWNELSVSPVRDKDNRLTHFIGVQNDITARRAIQETRRKYEFIVNASQDLMALINQNHVYEAANQAYCQAQGKSASQIIGQPVKEILSEQLYHKFAKESLEQCLAGQEIHQQMWLELTHKEQRYFDLAYYPYYGPEGTVTHAAFVARDVTERRRAYEAEQRRRREAEIIRKATAALTTAPDLSTALDTALTQVKRLLEYDSAAIFLLDEEQNRLQAVASRGLPDPKKVDGRYFTTEGLFELLLQKRTPHYLSNAQKDPRFAGWGETDYVKGWLGVPLLTRNKIIGYLTLDSRQEGAYQQAEAQLIQPLAHQIGITIENMRLFEQTQTALSQTEALYQVSRALIEQFHTPDLLQIIVDSMAAALQANRIILITIDPDHQEIIDYVLGGPTGQQLYRVPLAELLEGLTGWVLRRGEVAVSLKGEPDPREPEHVQARRQANDSGSIIVVPLRYQEEILGTVTAINRTAQPDFNQLQIDLLQSMANQAVVGLKNLRLYEQMQQELERRRAITAELKESETHLRSVVDNAIDGIITIDEKGQIQSFNPAAEQIFGYSASELIGQNVTMLMPEPDHSQHDQYLLNYLKTGQKNILGQGREVIARHQEGHTFPMDLAVSEFYLGDERRFIGIVRDIAERKQLEEELRQAQKMEAVGRLAGGIAHDFNNILTVIQGHSELLLLSPTQAGLPNQTRHDLEQIKKASDRAAMLTRQLLTFSRRQPVESQPLHLNQVVVDLGEMLYRLIGEDVTLVTRFAPDLDKIEADPGQMEQVVMNLVVNARDALGYGGRIEVETENVYIQTQNGHWPPEAKSGKYVKLSVSDTGMGMDEATQEHIFEPFFTTKESGKGTGLGLSTVYGIVQQNQGFIQVDSKPGKGTTFNIYLPSMEEEIPEAEELEREELDLSGEETVLLVEDDPGVRMITRKFLEKRGYEVLETSEPEVALEICRQSSAPIALLITDVIMPDISGPDLARQLMGIYPDLRVLYISGYANEILDQHNLAESEAALLEKPFSSEALARRVRKILDSA